MASTPAPNPSTVLLSEQPTGSVTTMVVEQRPLGEFARGSYVWPAWAVVLLALTTVGLWVWTRVRARLARKAPSE